MSEKTSNPAKSRLTHPISPNSSVKNQKANKNVNQKAQDETEKLFLAISMDQASQGQSGAEQSSLMGSKVPPTKSRALSSSKKSPKPIPKKDLSFRETKEEVSSDFSEREHNPPNTPNCDHVYSPDQPQQEQVRSRSQTAKKAAECLLNGLKVSGQLLQHRSPKHSAETLMFSDEQSDRDPVPVNDSVIKRMPSAYQNFCRAAVTPVKKDEKQPPKVSEVNYKCPKNIKDRGAGSADKPHEVDVKVVLQVGQNTSKPATIRFLANNSGDIEPVGLFFDEQKLWSQYKKAK